ncbi:MAG: ribosome biogenesis GTPase Der [Chloroflexi bacterium]|nr:ribosome biogenesis GTPase Der [Chloroflexota bacterium]
MTFPADTSLDSPARASVKPVVAIVGRPNVGKSTLFNRLLGRREAITEAAPGTTRDRLYGDVKWEEATFLLVDTAGMETAPAEELAQRVQEQARLAVAEADVILFLVDSGAGILPADEEVADLLRRSHKPVLLVANKAEHRAREQAAAEFYALGLGDPIPISAYHGTGIADLMEQLLPRLPRLPEAPLAETGVRLAIIGRPNVGKSMLVNAILGQERVLVSATPGTTRDATDTSFTYQNKVMTLIDTAGVRRSGRVEQGIEHYSVLRALRAIQRADVAVLLFDATEGVTAQDAHVGGYVQEAFKGLVLAVNKWDMAEALGLQREQMARVVAARLKFVPGAPLVFVSALQRQGIGTLLDETLRVQAARQQRVPTAAVNQCVQRAVQSHPPSAVRGRQFKILYVTQTEAAPPTFVFFVNDATLLHFSYQRFLENRLREAFGFAGAPLRLIFKNRREE